MQNTLRIYLAKINENIGQERIDYLLQSLSDENKERFYRFHFMKDSLRTLYGEILVRYVVSKQFALKNNQIKIEKKPHGKPYIPNLPIHFNISHAGDWIACAFSSHNIGVDIERIKDIDLRIAERFFSKEECSYLLKQNESKRLDTFYDFWTLKESYIKWLGLGLSVPLDSFHFSFSSGRIFMTDKNRTDIPFFHQYQVTGYKLSVCSSIPDFPKHVEEMDLEELRLDS